MVCHVTLDGFAMCYFADKKNGNTNFRFISNVVCLLDSSLHTHRIFFLGNACVCSFFFILKVCFQNMSCAFYDAKTVCRPSFAAQTPSFSFLPNSRILAFGTSLLRQLVEELLCGGTVTFGTDLRASYTSLDNRFTKKNMLPKPCLPHCSTNEHARYSLQNNVTITTVLNWPHLQRFSQTERLTRFLAEHKFTHILFMVPHQECFFDWLKNKTYPMCIDTQHAYAPDPRYVGKYTKIFKETRTELWTVLPWTQQRLHGEFRPIPTRHVFLKHSFCSHRRCGRGEYHQCSGSRGIVRAARFVAKSAGLVV